MILHKDYVYYDVTKTGSRTLFNLLTTQYYGKITRRTIIEDERFAFASVRNPYDRICSLWWSTCKRTTEKYGFDKYGFAKHGETLEQFAEWLSTNPTVSDGNDLVLTQSYQLRQFRLDYIIHYESFIEDIENLPFYKGHKIKHLNRTDRPKSHTLLTDTVIDIINNWCPEDFTNYGYNQIATGTAS